MIGQYIPWEYLVNEEESVDQHRWTHVRIKLTNFCNHDCQANPSKVTEHRAIYTYFLRPQLYAQQSYPVVLKSNVSWK